MLPASISRRLRAGAAGLFVAAALPLAPIFGPPWISIESPPNPLDSATRDAYLVVRTYRHETQTALGVTGRAEGMVKGARRSVPLTFGTTATSGVYTLRKQWTDDGAWLLVINTGGANGGATALVEVGADGQVASVRVPSRSAERGMRVPVSVSARDVDAALASHAARLAPNVAGASGTR
jgi:hypothetical protein